MNLQVVWKGLCVLSSGLSSPRKNVLVFCLEQYGMFVRFFLYSENYKCGTKAIKHEHPFAIMVSIDLNIVHKYTQIYHTNGIFVYVPAYVIIVSLPNVQKYNVCTVNLLAPELFF